MEGCLAFFAGRSTLVQVGVEVGAGMYNDWATKEESRYVPHHAFPQVLDANPSRISPTPLQKIAPLFWSTQGSWLFCELQLFLQNQTVWCNSFDQSFVEMIAIAPT